MSEKKCRGKTGHGGRKKVYCGNLSVENSNTFPRRSIFLKTFYECAPNTSVAINIPEKSRSAVRIRYIYFISVIPPLPRASCPWDHRGLLPYFRSDIFEFFPITEHTPFGARPNVKAERDESPISVQTAQLGTYGSTYSREIKISATVYSGTSQIQTKHNILKSRVTKSTCVGWGVPGVCCILFP